MVIVSDANGKTDGSAYQFVSKIPTDTPILLVSRVGDFVFNEQVNLLAGEKYVLVDFIEYGWDWDWKRTHVWGQNTGSIEFLNTPEYLKLDDFLSKNPPALTFKRELHTKDENEIVLPIEYPNWNGVQQPQSKDEFENRQLSVVNFWGRSHEMRVQFHGDVWKNASLKGYSVCDNMYYFNNFMAEEKGEKWLSLWIPHYGRVDISNIISILAMSKIAVSLPGAGIKCFRSTGEACVASAMVMPFDNLAWSIPWKHKENCFRVWSEDVIGGVNEALNYAGLYDIYLNGLETARRYQVDNYINDYLLPHINKA